MEILVIFKTKVCSATADFRRPNKIFLVILCLLYMNPLRLAWCWLLQQTYSIFEKWQLRVFVSLILSTSKNSKILKLSLDLGGRIKFYFDMQFMNLSPKILIFWWKWKNVRFWGVTRKQLWSSIASFFMDQNFLIFGTVVE